MIAYFNLPDFILGEKVYSTLINFSKQDKEYFLPNTAISCIYGNFPNCIWNGGSLYINNNWGEREISGIIEYYNYCLNIPLRFTFTNPLIKKEHLTDTYSNIIAKCGHNGNNEILVSSSIMEEYLRNKYPNYKFCRSIIASEKEAIDNTNKYYLSVCQRNKNNNWKYLDSIPTEQRGRIEFLCNDSCPDDCPRIYDHYLAYGKAQLAYSLGGAEIKCIKEKGIFPYKNSYSLKTFITRKMIDEEYLPRGFNQFKISGRGNIMNPIFGAINYLINPIFLCDTLNAIIN